MIKNENIKNENTMKITDLTQQIIKDQISNQWFVINLKNKVHYFFHTKTTKTGRFSGVFITLQTDEHGTRIYSETRNFNEKVLIPLVDYVEPSNINQAVDFMQHVLDICLKNGQKISK